MSIYVTVRLSVEPAAFEAQGKAHPDAFERIMAIAHRNGLIANRWFRGDGEIMGVEEWPDAESFQAFFEEAGPEIAPLMTAAGVTSPPVVQFWGHVDIDDISGWGI